MARLIVFAAVLVMAFLAMASLTSGQITTGTILGTVTDGTGAVTPAAAQPNPQSSADLISTSTQTALHLPSLDS